MPNESSSRRSGPQHRLRVLAVDDEAPSLADLVYELRAVETIALVSEAHDANEALRALRLENYDAVFLDVRMPGLDGLELARVLAQFRTPPCVVFVSAFDAHAVDAFEVSAVDYLLKPVRRERIELAVSKVLDRLALRADGASAPETAAQFRRPDTETSAKTQAAIVEPAGPDSAPIVAGSRHPFDDDLISIESGGRMRVVDRRDVLFVESSGDYVRLHVASGSVLVRAAMATLEEHWAKAGFVRIHRSYLVSLPHVTEVLIEHGHSYRVEIGDRSLPVSRRMVAQLRTRLLDYAARRARPGNG